MNACVIRNTYGDRSALLRLSLEYQEQAEQPKELETFIFIDPNPEFGISKDYEHSFFDKYQKIIFEDHKERRSWYLAVDYVFENYDFEYVISIEDDIIISKDYLKICDKIINDNILNKHENVLYFHIGAWEEPKGDVNKIVYSGASSRSILIDRNKFKIIKDHVNSIEKNKKIGNDALIKNILDSKKMRTIAPQYNRHGHFGIYGWSSTGVGADINGQKSIFEKEMNHEQLYNLLKQNCLSGDELLKLNKYKNPKYFWDFNPDIYFEKLIYKL